MASVADLLTRNADATADRDASPEVVNIDDSAGAFESLSSETARDIVASLSSDTATASELAERVETSLQNARYHLDRLESAGLVEVVGTRYSTKGNPMDIYATSGEPLLLVAGDVDDDALARAIGGD
jgi:DNA-binding transcriptional ArsR family regulator